MTELTWWPTTWGRVEPGDFVQAPDGSAWEVRGALEQEGEPTEYVIGQGAAWTSTTQEDDAPVTAARTDPPQGYDPRSDMLGATAALLRAFPEVAPLRR